MRRVRTDWTTQADLRLYWAYRSFCWFCHALAQAGAQKNLKIDICLQQRLRPTCASVQSDRGLRCPHVEALCLGTLLPKEHPTKILIRLREWGG